ncbi:DM13 domain-containing protein [Anabaena cylindrica FACHB-243]|uniref:Electron transfer DM13 n=1 Tax=Anabaena cylindrica (strain ATCC 27899 / PCC 7122) TaxID=272123 RepID=K9ZBW5_ANACC|nr:MULTISPECIES: DM13 domain-containing protein [Anabaena]AFZ56112.1 Electron transfer DM13 [Anabaena cylindrica PCC 7122]MBD2417343.1 DM13 domain-containing protein [Anabaena cylindrica FACHB-243]MBY5284054.1 DM13 domain-containing protein [Anabaena sp. CCAP 1446/1C]MBY5310742.1 DM13 domain-containing protein [Anabaena sp. CCAP 1446/1C]MCM2404424.1 DM13 domain-containing protein [Anabaena sp. CCAP 1446/1C]
MKLKYLAIFGIVAIVTVGCTKEVSSTPINNQPESVASVTPSVVQSESFKTLEHRTQGKVSIITINSNRYLALDNNFNTDHGPDLVVILYRGDKPPKYNIKKQDYISIASLQKTKGSQRYALPKNVRLSDFGSVGIWCRRFNVSFGYAGLPK